MNINMPKVPYIDRVVDQKKYLSYFEKFVNEPELLKTEFNNGDSLLNGLEVTDQQMKELYEAGHLYFSQQDYENAAKHFLYLAIMDNLQPAYWFCYANCCYYMKNYADALASYAMYSELKPDEPLPFFIASQCLKMTNQIEEAFKACERAIELAGSEEKYADIKENAEKQKEDLEEIKLQQL